MSLLRLLTTGKSLVGVRDTESRYRLTTQRLLPEFGPAKNPFRNSPRSEPASAEALFAGDGGTSSASREDCIGANSGVTASTGLSGSVQDQSAFGNAGRGTLVAAVRTQAAALLGGCKAKLAWMFGRARAKTFEPAIPRFTKPAVQGEFSLDRIRVVRNDLSDADLEVVPAKTSTVPVSSEPTSRAERGSEPAEPRRPGVTAELFGAGKA